MIQNHPGFRDISIDHELLLQLPADSSVLDELDSAGITDDAPPTPDEPQRSEGVKDDDDIEDFTTAAVPDTRAQNLEIEDLRRGKLSFSSPTNA